MCLILPLRLGGRPGAAAESFAGSALHRIAVQVAGQESKRQDCGCPAPQFLQALRFRACELLYSFLICHNAQPLLKHGWCPSKVCAQHVVDLHKCHGMLFGTDAMAYQQYAPYVLSVLSTDASCSCWSSCVSAFRPCVQGAAWRLRRCDQGHRTRQPHVGQCGQRGCSHAQLPAPQCGLRVPLRHAQSWPGSVQQPAILGA